MSTPADPLREALTTDEEIACIVAAHFNCGRDAAAVVARAISFRLACLATKPAADHLEWAVERWNAEVKNRPLVNVRRRSLDDTWRQVIRHFGGDDRALIGPTHDERLAQAHE